jgi:hypothetical protein
MQDSYFGQMMPAGSVSDGLAAAAERRAALVAARCRPGRTGEKRHVPDRAAFAFGAALAGARLVSALLSALVLGGWAMLVRAMVASRARLVRAALAALGVVGRATAVAAVAVAAVVVAIVALMAAVVSAVTATCRLAIGARPVTVLLRAAVAVAVAMAGRGALPVVAA